MWSNFQWTNRGPYISIRAALFIIYLVMYRVSHVLVDLGWVDHNLGVSPILPICPATSAKFPSAQAELGRQWKFKSTKPSQQAHGTPCISPYLPPHHLVHVVPIGAGVTHDPVADTGGDEPVQPGAVPLVQVLGSNLIENI